MDVSYDFSKNGNELENIIESVKETFQNELTKEKLDLHLYSLCPLRETLLQE